MAGRLSAGGHRKLKAEDFYQTALWYLSKNNNNKSLHFAEKAFRSDPNDYEIIMLLAEIGMNLKRSDIERRALRRLIDIGRAKTDQWLRYCELLYFDEKYELSLEYAEKLQNSLPKIKAKTPKRLRDRLEHLIKSLNFKITYGDMIDTRAPGTNEKSRKKIKRESKGTREKSAAPKKPPARKESAPAGSDTPEPVKKLDTPEIPLQINLNAADFESAFSRSTPASLEQYQLTLDAYAIRLQDSFESLICLKFLTDVKSVWYQEETARKVMKSFRGRALLSDEVGLGKTIEALMIFTEYVRRGMVKSALVLTPTPLVSQWRDEMRTKFGLTVSSTDDPDYKIKGDEFWKEPFVLASINQAKAKKNFGAVTSREYDLVIVDEAHHLKNKNTLNWKLVNALKKRFLLLLTATPVENNLMELYNLITLLKPGQLKTPAEFKQEFMTRGDPTDPRNRQLLKDLLNQVMIRNTRALARIDIPPRFAETVRIDPTKSEKDLYERTTALVQSMDRGGKNRMLLKTLMTEAGSSPWALRETLYKMLEKREMTKAQKDEIRAIHNLCRSMDDTRKNRVLADILKNNPGKIIVFVKYKGTLEHVSDFLSWHKIPCAVFHGGMSNPEKDRRIEEFRDKADVLLTTEIGGEGRNLQFCHQMVNYDLPWNPMKIEQRIGRIHRIGQEKEVKIFNFCAAGSVEDYILEILDKKINMFEMVIGEIDMILGRVREERDFSDAVYDLWVDAATDADRKKSFDKLGTHLKRSKSQYLKTRELDEKLFGENYEI